MSDWVCCCAVVVYFWFHVLQIGNFTSSSLTVKNIFTLSACAGMITEKTSRHLVFTNQCLISQQVIFWNSLLASRRVCTLHPLSDLLHNKAFSISVLIQFDCVQEEKVRQRGCEQLPWAAARHVDDSFSTWLRGSFREKSKMISCPSKKHLLVLANFQLVLKRPYPACFFYLTAHQDH